jgi:hypothetical protein
MRKPKSTYVGDAALKRLLQRYRCPAPFHVVRMRFWGAIASPSSEISFITVMQRLWSNGAPQFADVPEANAFLQSLRSLWNELTRYQDGSPKLKLQKIGIIDTREKLHAATKLRVGELHDGFLEGFMDGKTNIDVPPGTSELVGRVEKAIELLATMRNTFAQAPGRDDDAILAECVHNFPMIDEAVHADLNAIAIAVKRWRGKRLDEKSPEAKRRGTLH